VRHTQFPQVGAGLNEVQGNIRHRVARHIEDDDIMRVQVKENRDGEQVSTCDVDKLERVELTFFLLRRGQIRERNLLYKY
jgi:hypothetical protein